MWRDSMSGSPLLVNTWGEEAFHKIADTSLGHAFPWNSGNSCADHNAERLERSAMSSEAGILPTSVKSRLHIAFQHFE
jgi:hypothetical protein